MTAEKTRKKVRTVLIPAGATPYELLARLIETKRPDLAVAKIALCWRYGWEPDADGRLKLGQCKKRNELDRALADFDFAILLNADVWELPCFKSRRQEALLMHELRHAVVVLDDDGQPKLDEKDRIVTRISKHDIEQFASIVEEFGWDEDLAADIDREMRAKEAPLLHQTKKPRPKASAA